MVDAERRGHATAREIAQLNSVEVDHRNHAGLPSAAEKFDDSSERIPVESADWPDHDPVAIHQYLDRWFGIPVVTRPHRFAPPFAVPHDLASFCALDGDNPVTVWDQPVDGFVRQHCLVEVALMLRVGGRRRDPQGERPPPRHPNPRPRLDPRDLPLLGRSSPYEPTKHGAAAHFGAVSQKEFAA